MTSPTDLIEFRSVCIDPPWWIGFSHTIDGETRKLSTKKFSDLPYLEPNFKAIFGFHSQGGDEFWFCVWLSSCHLFFKLINRCRRRSFFSGNMMLHNFVDFLLFWVSYFSFEQCFIQGHNSDLWRGAGQCRERDVRLMTSNQYTWLQKSEGNIIGGEFPESNVQIYGYWNTKWLFSWELQLVGQLATSTVEF